MRLLHTSLDGYAYLSQNHIDWSSMGQVVAVVGATGSGKTAITESSLMAFYGATPTYSSPAIDAFPSFPGYLDATIESAGHTLRARLERTSQTQLRWFAWVDGIEQPTRGRQRDHIAALAPYLPPLDVLRASAFADQNRGQSICDMRPSQRAGLLATLLGDRLGALEAATVRARELRRLLPLERLRGHVEALRGVDVAQAREQVAAAEKAHQEAQAEVEAAEAAAEAWRGAVAAHADERRELEAQASERRRLEQALRAARERTASARDTLDRERGALVVADLLSPEEQAESAAELDRVARALAEVAGSIEAADNDARQVRETQAGERREVAKLEHARRAATQSEQALDAAERRERANAVPCRGEVAYIGHKGTEEVDCSACPLLVEARRHSGGGVAAARARLLGDRANMVLVEKAARSWTKARQEAEVQAEHSRERAEQERQLRQEQATIARTVSAHAAAERQRSRVRHAEQAVADAVALEEGAAADCDAVPSLEEAREKLAAIAAPPRPPAPNRKVVDQAAAELGRARAALEQAERQAAERQNAEEQVRFAAEAAGDLDVAALLLGAKGAQALEIERAAPSISAHATEIIGLIEPDRWEIALSTRRQGSKGDAIAEITIRVFDREKGREVSDAALLSGGQRAMVDESLRLAIAAYAAGNSPHPSATLWRDEMDGSLSPTLRRAYPAMLRRALRLAKAERLIFVTHDPTVARSADTVLVVRGGLALPFEPSELPEVY